MRPTAVAALVEPGKRACQRPVDVSAAARSVSFKVGTFGVPGPQLDVDVVTGAERRAAGVVPAGYGDVTWQRARLDRELREGERVAVCISNRGRRRVALYGGPAQAARTSSAYLGARMLPADLALVFERDDGEAAIGLVPAAFERAALWHPGWTGPWVFWVLLGGLVVGVPVLLGAALRSSAPATAAAAGTRPRHRP